jgi:outer membrane protein OmpA-like peptidoglycan-associated protein
MTVVLAQSVVNVSEGQKAKVLGYIVTRDADSFKLKTGDGSQTYIVVLTPDTSVKSNTKGVFRGGTKYESSYLLRGLRVEVEGTGNADGALVAKSVRFNETDLRAAQSLEVRAAPLEEETRSNTERITATEENQKRLAGQIEEVDAKADRAAAEAARANNRINGLDEWDSVKTISVPFATGSSTIGPKGRAIIDEAAAWVKTQNTKGWMVAVVGFADSTGRTAANKTLSEKRANSVIGYLVSKHNLPLQRLIQPFGAGVDQPVAPNTTAAGRAQNRRVEIRLLRNKGIADQQ